MGRPLPVIESIGEGATEEEIAARLTLDEGRTVSVLEVRLLITQALRKMRQRLAERGFTLECLKPRD